MMLNELNFNSTCYFNSKTNDTSMFTTNDDINEKIFWYFEKHCKENKSCSIPLEDTVELKNSTPPVVVENTTAAVIDEPFRWGARRLDFHDLGAVATGGDDPNY